MHQIRGFYTYSEAVFNIGGCYKYCIHNIYRAITIFSESRSALQAIEQFGSCHQIACAISQELQNWQQKERPLRPVGCRATYNWKWVCRWSCYSIRISRALQPIAKAAVSPEHYDPLPKQPYLSSITTHCQSSHISRALRPIAKAAISPEHYDPLPMQPYLPSITTHC